MSQSGAENFGAYKKARELFDLGVADMQRVKAAPLCYRLASQQAASADSICATIEEGYGRARRAEYVRFVDFAPGSARATRGRYERMKHWPGPDVVNQRIELADEIIGILTSSMGSMRRERIK